MSKSIAAEVKRGAKLLVDAKIESAQLEAQIIMAWVLGCSRLNIITHSDRILSDDKIEYYRKHIAKRSSRYPLSYITGHREFYGLDFHIPEGVLIPRQETEILVEECIKRLKHSSVRIADIGIGSGAISVALAADMPNSTIYATEISSKPLAAAKVNIEKHGLEDRIHLLSGNFAEPLVALNLDFDAIVSNPPYIPSDVIKTLEPEVGLYEPIEALDGGVDGLAVYRTIYKTVKPLLKSSGFVAVEIGIGQANSVENIAINVGYDKIEIINDLAGIERVVIAYNAKSEN